MEEEFGSDYCTWLVEYDTQQLRLSFDEGDNVVVGESLEQNMIDEGLFTSVTAYSAWLTNDEAVYSSSSNILAWEENFRDLLMGDWRFSSSPTEA